MRNKHQQTAAPLATASEPTRDKPGFIDQHELLLRLPVSRRTLANWRNSGKLPFVRLPGSRRLLFDWESVRTALLRTQNTE